VDRVKTLNNSKLMRKEPVPLKAIEDLSSYKRESHNIQLQLSPVKEIDLDLEKCEPKDKKVNYLANLTKKYNNNKNHKENPGQNNRNSNISLSG